MIKERNAVGVLALIPMLVAIAACDDLAPDDDGLDVIHEEVAVDAEEIDCGDDSVVVSVDEDGVASTSCQLSPTDPDELVPQYCLLRSYDVWLSWNAGPSIYICVDSACGRARRNHRAFRHSRWGWIYRARSGSLCTN